MLSFVSLVIALTLSASAQSFDADALVKKIQGDLTAAFPPPDGKPDPNVPHGEMLQGKITDSAIFPGTENPFQVYVPARYDASKPACLLVKLDGFSAYEGTVLDNLIAKKEVPVIIGVGITPGTIWKNPEGKGNRTAARFNRSYEFDSMNDHFPDYVLNELLPAVQRMRTKDGRAIRISTDGNDHAATGGSTGGIGSFTLAWRRPDQFRRVYSVIGTYVSMRGGHEYPVLVRKTDPKPIRIFMEDGSTDSWNLLFGSWYDANLNLESALTFAGYDVAHAWGEHGHNGRPGQVIFPDVMRWLWRGYPAAIKAGVSKNSTLEEVTMPGEAWKTMPRTFQSASGLAVDAKGDVYVSDSLAKTVYRVSGGDAAVFAQTRGAVSGQAFGPDGTLYALVPGDKKIVAVGPKGELRTIADGIVGKGITVTHEGVIYVSDPGAHSDMPSRIWQINGGAKKVLDQGLFAASGLAFYPDGSLLLAAEKRTKWVYSYVAQTDGSFTAKQPFYWLHMTDVPNDSGAEDMAVDTHGNLYVATRMGVQVCDQNGRVRAILPLPTPTGAARSLSFGGANMDVLYVTDGTQVFTRKMKVAGFAQWAKPIVVASKGGG